MFFSITAPTNSADRPTLEGLYTSHASRVMRWATRLLGDAQDAGDVTQEVFVIVQARLDRFTAREGSFETWLFRITENVVRNRWRSAKRRAAFALEPALEMAQTSGASLPDEALEARRAARLVAEILALMSRTDRELLVLFELDGHPGEQVAEMLGLSPSVIWVRLHRARARFAEKLKSYSPEEAR